MTDTAARTFCRASRPHNDNRTYQCRWHVLDSNGQERCCSDGKLPNNGEQCACITREDPGGGAGGIIKIFHFQFRKMSMLASCLFPLPSPQTNTLNVSTL